jgi:hypothetical protein
MSDQFPITKAGYIVSPRCPNAISGLFIELQRLPYDNDLVKYDQFISRPSFNRYLKAAAWFGFYVDKNVPWRIAANMDSPPMIEYMERYGVHIEDNSVFKSYFYESEYFSYESIKSRLWNLYASLIVNPSSKTYGTTYEINNCTYATWNNVDGNRYQTTISDGYREEISLDYENEFKKEYTDEYFLPVYLRIRLAESGIKYRPRQLISATKNILDRYKALGIHAAISYLGSLVEKTNIYEKIPIDKKPPYKIKYFGKSTSSGLYSYEKPAILKKEKMDDPKDTQY